MQDYTPLGSTATTTVKEGILNHEKNINALRSTYSGAAFPTENLVAGLKCYRTDLGKTYTYNGEAWDDSVNTASLTVSGETSVPTPSTTNNSKTIANTEFVHGVVSDLVNGAPDALNTLQELATALGNDPNFSTTILNKIGEKENKTDAQIEHEKLQNEIDLCLKGKKSVGITPETNPQIIAIPLERGIFPIKGYPDGFTVADKKHPYSVVVNFQGESGALLSFYAQHSRRELYFRVGWPDERGWGLWTKLATTDEIPTKVSQLSNDSGYLTQHQSLDGYVKTSGQNTWRAQQTFNLATLGYEQYSAPYRSTSSVSPSTSAASYYATGAFTLNLATLSALLGSNQSTVFTAYITAGGDYALSISNGGTVKYIGAASDLAITSAGLLLNILMTKDNYGSLTSIVQANKLT